MTSVQQLQMFEPEGHKLAQLVNVYSKTAVFERRVADNLAVSGFVTAAQSRIMSANEADMHAATCEMALQFEALAGLA